MYLFYLKELEKKSYVLPETIKNKRQGNNPDRKIFMECFNLRNEQYKLRVEHILSN